MADSNLGPGVQFGSTRNCGVADETIDLRTDAGPAEGGVAGEPTSGEPRAQFQPYIRERQLDYVRLIVTVGLLLIFGFVVVWSCIESSSWSEHWQQTKEMVNLILPSLTGLIGSVIGFYFGSGVNSTNARSSGTNPTTSK